MPRITENIEQVLQASPPECGIWLIRGRQIQKVPRDSAMHLAQLKPNGYRLLVRDGRVRKMIAIEDAGHSVGSRSVIR